MVMVIGVVRVMVAGWLWWAVPLDLAIATPPMMVMVIIMMMIMMMIIIIMAIFMVRMIIMKICFESCFEIATLCQDSLINVENA